MQIREEYGYLEQSMGHPAYQISRGVPCRKSSQSLIAEHLMDVYINEISAMELVCTPQDLVELVLGRMFSEGMIRDISEVAYIQICEHGSKARVTLEHEQGSTVYQDIRPVGNIPWKAEWIWSFMDLFEQDTPLHRETGSTHSCFLMLDGEVIFQCEDIGRHNALDKAIGYALRRGIDLKHCAVYTSGRMPTDMVIKVIRAGIPIMASKEAPTREAVGLAQEYRLTLIGRAKKGQMFLYAGGLPV